MHLPGLHPLPFSGSRALLGQPNINLIGLLIFVSNQRASRQMIQAVETKRQTKQVVRINSAHPCRVMLILSSMIPNQVFRRHHQPHLSAWRGNRVWWGFSGMGRS